MAVSISEVSYEGLFTDDFVEIAAPAGADLSGYTIVIYDKDGNIDEILIEFSENMKDSSMAVADVVASFDFGATAVVGVDITTDSAGTVSINTGDPDKLNDKYITIFTDDSTVTGTDASAVEFTAVANKFEDSTVEVYGRDGRQI